jgi:hypothetical protein
MRLSFNDFMLKVGNIYYANNERMSRAFTIIEEAEKENLTNKTIKK